MRDIERRPNEVSSLTMSEKKGRVNRCRGCSRGVGSMPWRPIVKNDKQEDDITKCAIGG